VLFDLRAHGDSEVGLGPHTVNAAAGDVVESLQALVDAGEISLSSLEVAGHSFGGKVALASVLAIKNARLFESAGLGNSDEFSDLEHSTGRLRRVWILDSPPGVSDGELTRSVLDALGSLPANFATRDHFVRELVSSKIARGTAQWLAMNLKLERGRYHFSLDLVAIHALIDDFHRRDFWALLEADFGPRFELVVGGRSSALDSAQLVRARALAEQGVIGLTVLADAGHWIHVDDPDALLGCMAGVETKTHVALM